MLLRDTNGSLRLTVTGYQFPFAAQPEKRFSRHVIEGDVQLPRGRWRFRAPALNCDETPMVAMWLTAVADWMGDAEPEPKPTRLSFTERTLSFSIDERRAEEVILSIELAGEFRPPWLRPTDDSSCTLQLSQDAIALRRAAAAWTTEARAYPDELDPVRDPS